MRKHKWSLKKVAYSCILLSLIFPICNSYAQPTLTVTNKFYDSQSNSGSKGEFTISLLDDSFSNPIFVGSGNPYTVANPGYHYFHSEIPEYDDTGLSGLVDPYYLFMSWDNVDDDYLFTKSENLQSGNAVHESKFRYSRPADLHVVVDDENVNYALLDVRNPWKITQGASDNKFDQYVDFYATTNETERQFDYSVVHGVHVGKYPDPVDALKPYYSLRAAKFLTDYGSTFKQYPTYSLDAGDLIFHHWDATNVILATDPHSPSNSDYDTKAAVFSDNSTNQVIAWYKGHRMSTVEGCATSSNSQRKMAVDDNGTYHMVYESSNTIWHTTSSDKGATWTPEREVGEYNSNSHRPSISYWNDRLYVAYVQNNRVVIEINDLNAPYLWEELWYDNLLNPSLCNPVIEATNGCTLGSDPDIVTMVWEDTDVLNYVTVEMEILPRQLFRGTLGGAFRAVQPVFPTITVAQTQSFTFHILWREGPRVLYTHLETWHCKDPWVQAYPDALQINHAIFESAVGAPSVADDPVNGMPLVAFESIMPRILISWPFNQIKTYYENSVLLKGSAITTPPKYFSQTTYVIRYRMSYRSSLEMNPTLSIQLPEQSCPSSRYRKGVRALFVEPNTWYTIRAYQSLSPSSCIPQLQYHAYGSNPNQVTSLPTYDQLLDCFCDMAPAPPPTYSPKVIESSDNYLGKVLTGDSTFSSREMWCAIDTSALQVEIENVELLNGGEINAIEWQPTHDTVSIYSNDDIANKMRSEPVTVSDGDSIRIMLSGIFSDSQIRDYVEGVQLGAYDADSDTLIESWQISQDVFFLDTIRQSCHVFSLANVSGSAVIFKFTFNQSEVPEYTFGVRDIITRDIMALERDNGDGIASASPEFVQLHQNYPNPFNPSTAIKYYIPRPGEIRMSVYDITGRLVSTLYDGYSEAGWKTAAFDASNLPSGVYIYKLVTEKGTLTKLMHLVR